MSSAYVVAQLVIHDPIRYESYARAFASTLTDFDGQLLAADARPAALDGDWPYEKIVLIRFCDREEAMRWAASPAYQAISRDREASTTTTAILVEGVS